MIKKTTKEVEEIQKEWGDAPCDHIYGFGHEVDDYNGGDNDCFCVRCGRRAPREYFIERMKK